MIDSLERYIFSLTHILIAETCERIQMLIYRAFPDIASPRVGDLERAESCEKSREEEYTDADFLYLLSIEVFDRHLRTIE